MSRYNYAVLVGVATAIAIIALSALSAFLYRAWLNYRREEFIRSYRWPAGLLERLERHHAGFERKDSALVSRGLRQFFLAYLRSGQKFVSMPSQIADDLWHEFILYTREYQAFCSQGVRRLPASHPGRRAERQPQEQRGPAPGVVAVLPGGEHRSRASEPPAAAVRARRQIQDCRRLHLSARSASSSGKVAREPAIVAAISQVRRLTAAPTGFGDSSGDSSSGDSGGGDGGGGDGGGDGGGGGGGGGGWLRRRSEI